MIDKMMKKSYYKILIFLLIPTVLQSCYSLTVHQTAKPLGKGNMNVNFVTGVHNPAELTDKNTYELEYLSEYAGVISPQLQVNYGMGEHWDLGISLGYTKNGLFTKYHFLGDSTTSFDMAVGTNVFTGKFYGTPTDESVEGTYMTGFELPLFMSYDIAPNFSYYLHPSLNYLDYYPERENLTADHNVFLNSGLYLGAATGLFYQSKYSSVNFSLEVSVLRPLQLNEYNLSISTGIGFKFQSIFKK